MLSLPTSVAWRGLRRASVRTLLGCAGLALAAGSARAQDGGADILQRGRERGGARPPAGFYQRLARDPWAFDFARGWRERARRVSERRAVLRGRREWQALNARVVAAAAEAPPAVTGTLRVPTFMFSYSNVANPFDTTLVTNLLWSESAAPPYSVTTYYREVSRNRVTVTGDVLSVVQLSQIDSVYEGGSTGTPPTFCQGLCDNARIQRMIEEAVAALDAAVDFGRYDNDGPDGVPNSLDDDGFVDAVVLLHPEVGGECRAVNSASEASIWAHRFFYSGWSSPQPRPRTAGLLTGDARTGGGLIRVDDYIIQGSQGGTGGCSSGLPLSIGTISHETGHLFGLPDLYNTQDGSPGVGRWDLMGSGSERRPDRPAHLSAWSRADLGWVTEVPLTASTMVSAAGPIEVNDSAYVVPIAGSDEYFLLENRQQIGSDLHLASPGLLIWHVDSLLMRTRRSSNRVNAQFPNALKLEQADGLENLTGGLPVNRGDPGDPFPGSANKTRFAFDTSPPANRNSGAYAGVQVDSIAQVVLGGAMRFRIRFGAPSVVRASDTTALVKVRGATYAVFRDVLEDGDTATIEIDSVQFSADSRTRYLFVSWSDGGARRHGITAVLAGATYTATVSRSHRATLTISGAGTVAVTPSLDLAAGVLVAEGDSVALLATPGPSNLFTGWSGDTTLADLRLLLRMRRPYTLTASFTEISLDSVVGQLLRGSGLPGVIRVAFDAQGNANGRFDLGDFVAWLDRSRTPVPSAVMRPLVERGSR